MHCNELSEKLKIADEAGETLLNLNVNQYSKISITF